jgi:hypothetical protein
MGCLRYHEEGVHEPPLTRVGDWDRCLKPLGPAAVKYRQIIRVRVGRKLLVSLRMSTIACTLPLALTAASACIGNGGFSGIIAPAMAASPEVGYCAPDSPAQDLTLFVGDLNVGVPLPERFSNGTTRPVTFTTTMKANRLFGSERVVDRRTIPPNLFVSVFHLFLGVTETTPLGTDTVVIEVTSSATGRIVLGRCTFNLTVTRRVEQRDVIGIPLRPCILQGTELASDLTANPPAPIPPGKHAPAGTVIRLIGQINDEIWLKHARIVFRAAASPGVPVIANPRNPGPTPRS